jgi:hypothetical protein
MDTCCYTAARYMGRTHAFNHSGPVVLTLGLVALMGRFLLALASVASSTTAPSGGVLTGNTVRALFIDRSRTVPDDSAHNYVCVDRSIDMVILVLDVSR